MSEIIELIFSTLVLIPGFLCIFIPFKILLIKIRYTDTILTLLSLIISILIFGLSLLTYQLLGLYTDIIHQPLDINDLSLLSLFSNQDFVVLFIIFNLVCIFLVLVFISKDRLRYVRRWITGRDIIIDSCDYVWDKAFDNHKGYHVIKTTNNDLFFGLIVSYTYGLKEKEVLLKYPFEYNEENGEYERIDDAESILFLDSDIKRIYFVASSHNSNHSNK